MRYKKDTQLTLKTTLIQIIPQNPSEPNGVGHYALQLATQLAGQGVDNIFVCANQTSVEVHDLTTVCLPSKTAVSLAKVLGEVANAGGQAIVMLHYSGYGYQKRGVPIWLARGLYEWSHSGSPGRCPLVTVFHEVFAIGRPWQSSFWLSPMQRSVAKTILNLSNKVITPTEAFGKILSMWNAGIDVTCMPVFSNVGEPDPEELLSRSRSRSAVVFGLGGVEDRIYGTYRTEVERLVSLLGIREIIDVGPRTKAVPSKIAGVPVISKGELPHYEVSEILKGAEFGFVAYPTVVLGKSGAFAAYAAHAVVPVVISATAIPADGLQPGRHYVDGLRTGDSNCFDNGAIKTALSNWYRPHSLKVQAHNIQNMFQRDLSTSGFELNYA